MWTRCRVSSPLCRRHPLALRARPRPWLPPPPPGAPPWPAPPCPPSRAVTGATAAGRTPPRPRARGSLARAPPHDHHRGALGSEHRGRTWGSPAEPREEDGVDFFFNISKKCNKLKNIDEKMFPALPKNVDEKNVNDTSEKCWRKNVDNTSEKCWQKMLTKNVGNTSEKFWRKCW
jgi:hypothetical protein